MFGGFWENAGRWIIDALVWFVTGLLGTLQTATRFRTDVPWYQCLASQLIVLAIAVPVVLLVERRREKRRYEKRLREIDRE